jgi:hypothetical protein
VKKWGKVFRWLTGHTIYEDCVQNKYKPFDSGERRFACHPLVQQSTLNQGTPLPPRLAFAISLCAVSSAYR